MIYYIQILFFAKYKARYDLYFIMKTGLLSSLIFMDFYKISKKKTKKNVKKKHTSNIYKILFTKGMNYMKQNYQIILENTLKEIQSKQIQNEKKPTLFLHSCCAPCSTYVLEYLSKFFEITIFFYNPNISSAEEFNRRILEQERLISLMQSPEIIHLQKTPHNPQEFSAKTKGLENEAEGGLRCRECFALRLEKTAKFAQESKADFFTTTLSISPHKNAQLLNELGSQYAEIYEIPYLHSDFKKKGGFARSTELSSQYHLYRQDYCGCIFSKLEAEQRKQAHHESNPTQQ